MLLMKLDTCITNVIYCYHFTCKDNLLYIKFGTPESSRQNSKTKHHLIMTRRRRKKKKKNGSPGIRRFFLLQPVFKLSLKHLWNAIYAKPLNMLNSKTAVKSNFLFLSPTSTCLEFFDVFSDLLYDIVCILYENFLFINKSISSPCLRWRVLGYRHAVSKMINVGMVSEMNERVAVLFHISSY
ncbi:hypothetical protein KUTeg_005226 [Tegillarca granosa]|uniref:Uncharacterized protein n=1 Tax=Tegillarca granosa TaxID=220873 RepID=A0ABQ9FN16_TEGGR|nr:hypothetical protein KUTeg_005226 [Tegillarca granosa]